VEASASDSIAIRARGERDGRCSCALPLSAVVLVMAALL
jgi:hypothetical protein